jgi:exopolysaccharide biosynthesis polyprenyl glycosylphosphotransferase
MLGKRRLGWTLRLLAADVGVLVVAFFAAYGIRVLLDDPLGRAAGPLEYYLWLLAVTVPAWIGFLALLGGYGIGWTTRSRAALAFGVSGMGLLLLTASLFLVKESDVNRSLLLLFALMSGAGLWAERGLIRAWLRRTQTADGWAHVALVVGTDHRAASVIAALHRYPEAQWLIRGCLSLDAAEPGRAVSEVPVVGSLQDLPDILQGDGVIDEVFFAVSADRLDGLTDALQTCESLGVDTRVLVDFYRPAHAYAFLEELFALPFYGFSPSLTRQGAFLVKRLIDILVAAFLLVVSSPLLLVMAVAVKLTSRGPVIFHQERAGFHGRRFRMHKFRTMVVGAEGLRDQLTHLNEMSGPVFKVADDPRLTSAGRMLRRLSLDELPQLVNVVKGEMSLVGPRPLPVYEARRIKDAQRRRLAVRPGITGLWQVSGRNTVDFEEWMHMDLLYVDQWSLLLDFKILVRTIPAVLGGKGAR